MAKEYLDIVDENGNPTGQIVDRETAHRDGVPHRTSHLWLLRKREGRVQLLLQKRSVRKPSYPGCYDISSAGHIPAGVDYAASAIRELWEELGVTATEDELVVIGHRWSIADTEFFGKPFHDRQISRVFYLWRDLEEDQFTLQAEEVDEVRWMDLEECIRGMEEGTFQHCLSMVEMDMIRKALNL